LITIIVRCLDNTCGMTSKSGRYNIFVLTVHKATRVEYVSWRVVM